jgi:hypothetical protein
MVFKPATGGGDPTIVDEPEFKLPLVQRMFGLFNVLVDPSSWPDEVLAFNTAAVVDEASWTPARRWSAGRRGVVVLGFDDISVIAATPVLVDEGFSLMRPQLRATNRSLTSWQSGEFEGVKPPAPTAKPLQHIGIRLGLGLGIR